MFSSIGRWLYTIPLALALVACGGGAKGTDTASTTDTATAAGTDDATLARLRSKLGLSAAVTSTASSQWVQVGAVSDQDAARFLNQAAFGPTPADVVRVKSMGFDGWLKDQMSMALPTPSYQAYFEARNAEWMALPGGGGRAGPMDLTDPIWRNAIVGEDQLRTRVALALSEIFVVSISDTCGQFGRAYASYMDMLTRNAFGTYRQLLQDVAMHPIMGCYLSHMANQKDDPKTGRVPDENFAREIMQLFSIGLYQLNLNGTPVMANGQPVLTYGPSDVAGMARVFTGFSFNCPSPYEDACFFGGNSTQGSDPDKWVKPMVAYDRFHSTLEKRFLGKVIPAQDTPNAWASVRVALDTLSTHPNVGPFIGKQLIQKLVTSNPSPAYVARVAQAFNSSGGNLGAMVSAILLDVEARDTAAALASDRFGKVREPIHRVAALLRAMDARSMTGRFAVGWTPDPDIGLNQAPLMAPSVFNFFRPGFVLPGSTSASLGLLTPELQMSNETTVAAFANYVFWAAHSGVGMVPNFGAGINGVKRPDVYMDYQRNSASSWLALADQPEALVDELNRRLLYGTMSTSLRTDVISVVKSLTDSHPEIRQPDRISRALLIIATSPEFLVQR